MKNKPIISYTILGLTLIFLGFIFFKFPYFRIITSIIMGISYFIWGLITHQKDSTLHLFIVLEYLAISLLSTIILIFLSLRV